MIAYDTYSNSYIEDKIHVTIHHSNNEIVQSLKITMEDGISIMTTPDHLMLVQKEDQTIEYKLANSIKEEDRLKTFDNKTASKI